MFDEVTERELGDLVEKIVERAFELKNQGQETAALELIAVSDEILRILGYI